MTDPDPDYGPYVCPGCYAVAAPCDVGCPEAEEEMRREDERDRCRLCGGIDCDDPGHVVDDDEEGRW